MALHKKNYPGPKNFVTKKYPTKSHNPSHPFSMLDRPAPTGREVPIGRLPPGGLPVREEGGFFTRTRGGSIDGVEFRGEPEVLPIITPFPSRSRTKGRRRLPRPRGEERAPAPRTKTPGRHERRHFGSLDRPTASVQPGRRVGRNLTPGTPRRVGSFSPSVFGRGVSASFGSRRRRPLSGKKKTRRRNLR